MSKKVERLFLLTIILVCSILFLYNLGNPHLSHWDEAWYADVSRTMLNSGNFLTPVWNGQPFFEKPPLYYWISVISFSIFGINEFAVRFPSALAGILCIIVLYFYVKKNFNSKTAVFSTIILSSVPIFLYRARTGNLDVLLTLWMLFSIFCFTWAMHGNKKWFSCMAISIFLGFLTKGFIGLYPLFIIGIVLIFQRNWKVLKSKQFLSSVIMLGLFVCGFITIFYLINGSLFVNQFLLSNTEKYHFGEQNLKSFSLDYLSHIKSGLKLWFPFFLVSILYVMYGVKKNKNSHMLLPFLFIIIFFIIMSFSHNTSNWYIIPLYPFVSLIIAYVFARIDSKNFLGFGAAGIAVGIAFIQLFFYKNEFFYKDVAKNDADIARAAKEITNPADTIFLTNYYFPSVVYYSQRRVLAVFSNNEYNKAWWVKPKTYWKVVFKNKQNTIITTNEELQEVQKQFPDELFKVYSNVGEKLVVKNE